MNVATLKSAMKTDKIKNDIETKQKLRIGLFVDNFFPVIDGVVMVVDNYAKRLSKDFEVIVFTLKNRHTKNKKKPYVDNFPYKVERCRSVKLFFLDYDMPLPKFDRKFKRTIRESKLDIIHVHSPFGIGSMGVKYAKKNKIPCIMTLHSQFKLDAKKNLKSRLLVAIFMRRIMRVFNRADVVWTMNPACERLIVDDYGYKGKVELVPNGTDLVAPDDVSEIRKATRAEYGLNNSEFVMINIGRINKLKNLDFVIEVIAELKKRGKAVKLLLVGTGVDEPYFKNKVKQLELENEVIFTGKITDVNKKIGLFAAADLQIFPSFYDTDGIVRIEAAACKTPTIFIENSIASSTITDNVNGYIGGNSVAAFADKIISAIDNPLRNKQIGEKAKKEIYINWDSVLEIVRGKYNLFLKSNSPA